MSWRKRGNPEKEKAKRDAQRETFDAALEGIIANDPNFATVSLKQLGLGEADAKALAFAMAGNTVVRSLDISKNHIRDAGAVYVSKIVRENTTLRRLNISFNEFTPLVVKRFDSAVRRNVSLQQLIIEEKATIPGTSQKLFHSCPMVAAARLRLELFIGENMCFDRAICGSTTSLELKNRRLETIPEVIVSLRHIVKLNLSNNCLTKIPSALGDLHSLEKLVLADNAIMALPESLAALKDLTTLDVSNNLLTSIPCSLATLPRLAVLNVEGNPLYERWQLPCEQLSSRLKDDNDCLYSVHAPFVSAKEQTVPVSTREEVELQDLPVTFAVLGHADAKLRLVQLLQMLTLCKEKDLSKKKLALVKKAVPHFGLEDLGFSVLRHSLQRTTAQRVPSPVRRRSQRQPRAVIAEQRVNVSFADASSAASSVVMGCSSIISHVVLAVFLREELASLQEFVNDALLSVSKFSARAPFVLLVGVLGGKEDAKSILSEERCWKSLGHKMGHVARASPVPCSTTVVNLATGTGLKNVLEAISQCPISALPFEDVYKNAGRLALETLRSMAAEHSVSTEPELLESFRSGGVSRPGDQRRLIEHAKKLGILASLPAVGKPDLFLHGVKPLVSIVRDLVSLATSTQLLTGRGPCVDEVTVRALIVVQWGHEEVTDRVLALLSQSGVVVQVDRAVGEPATFLVPPALPRVSAPDHPLDNGHIRVFEFDCHPGIAFGKLTGLLLSDAPSNTALRVESVFANRVDLFIPGGPRISASMHVQERSIFLSFFGGSDKASVQFVMRSMERVLESFQPNFQGVSIVCPHCCASKTVPGVVASLASGRLGKFPLSELETSIANGQSVYMCRAYKDWPVGVQLDKYMPDITMPSTDTLSMDYSRLKMGEQVGSGGFADVFLATLRPEAGDGHSERQVAVKLLRTKEGAAENFAEFRKEVAIMVDLQCPQLVSMIGFTKSPLSIVSELCPSGDLQKYLTQRAERSAPLSKKYLLRLLFDLAKGLSFLHTSCPPMIHRDLKPANVLLMHLDEPDEDTSAADGFGADASNDVVCKITDFGLTVQSTLPIENRRVMTPTWLAPEVMSSKPYSCASDMFAFGIIAVQCLTLRQPYEELDIHFNSQLEEAICAGARPAVSDDELAKLPPEARAAILRALAKEPDLRPTSTEMATILRSLVEDVREAKEEVVEEESDGCSTVAEDVTDMEELSPAEEAMLFNQEAEEEEEVPGD
mmetsp:Transcript_9079/g.37442  ORF Transcript_9079/g.37442 Transcript_9079/m.37442 type:complete len:1226 (+) Transcript_9079:43-3720(+)